MTDQTTFPLWAKTAVGGSVFGLMMIVVLVGSGLFGAKSGELRTVANDPAQRAAAAMSTRDWPMAEEALRVMVEADQLDGVALFNLGITLHQQGKYDEARECFLKTIEFRRLRVRSRYDLACVEAMSGNQDKALEYLEIAINSGFRRNSGIFDEPSFASIRQNPEFIRLVELEDSLKNPTKKK